MSSDNAIKRLGASRNAVQGSLSCLRIGVTTEVDIGHVRTILPGDEVLAGPVLNAVTVEDIPDRVQLARGKVNGRILSSCLHPYRLVGCDVDHGLLLS